MMTSSPRVFRGGSEGRPGRARAASQLALEKARAIAFDGPPAERAARFATILIVALGIWLRMRGYLFSTIPFWLDESSWAMLLIKKPLIEHLIRPIGFMALSKALASVLSPSETVLRFLPWTAGIATTLMAPFLGARLFRSTAARLLFVSVLALDPAAIDLAKEFKPYSIALAFHTGFLLLTLRYCQRKRTRDLVLVLATLGFSILFAQDAIFAFPGIFLVIGVDALRARRFKHFAATAATAVAAASVIGCLYFFVWSRLNQSKEEAYWGKKYDVFYVPSASGPNKADWTLGRYAALVETAGSRREVWTSRRVAPKTLAELTSLDQAVWLALHIAGLAVIARGRRGRDALLFAMPIGIMAAFNWLGFWPFGPFRTNLFTLVYVAAVAAVAFDRKEKGARFFDFAPVALLVLLPLFAFEKTWHRDKEMLSVTAPSGFPEALETLLRLQGHHSGRREKIVMDTHGCEPYRFYTKYHPLSKTLGAEIRRNFELRCSGGKDRTLAILSTARRVLRKEPRVWILATHDGVIQDLDQSWPDDLEKVALARIGENVHLIIGVKLKEIAEPPPPEPAVEEKPSPESEPEDHEPPPPK
jgi:hypothetical protein